MLFTDGWEADRIDFMDLQRTAANDSQRSQKEIEIDEILSERTSYHSSILLKENHYHFDKLHQLEGRTMTSNFNLNQKNSNYDFKGFRRSSNVLSRNSRLQNRNV